MEMFLDLIKQGREGRQIIEPYPKGSALTAVMFLTILIYWVTQDVWYDYQKELMDAKALFG